MRAHGAVLDEIRAAVESEHGLPLEWFDVLIHLEEAPGRRLRMTDLARSLALSKSWLSRRIDVMERAGLITRQAVPSDGRGSYAALTSKGLAVFRRADQTHRAVVERRFTGALPHSLESPLREALLAISDRPDHRDGAGVGEGPSGWGGS